MPWIALTASDLKLAAAEFAAIRAQGATDAGDPLLASIESAINEVRGRVAVAYPLGLAGTIPDTLKDAAIAIARWRALAGLPIKSLLTPQREAEYKSALELLKDVAAGKFAIATPEEVSTEAQQSTTPQPSFGRKTLVQSRDDQDGL